MPPLHLPRLSSAAPSPPPPKTSSMPGWIRKRWRAWMRPGTITSTVAKVDPRVGGRYEIIMQGESERFPHTGVYRVIDRPRRLVFTWHSPATDEKESLVTVDFLRLGAKTEVVVTHEQLPESARESHSRGWTSGLEHLDEACQRGFKDSP